MAETDAPSPLDLREFVVKEHVALVKLTDAETPAMIEITYTLLPDQPQPPAFRIEWTVALRDNVGTMDYTVAFTFSLKAFPRYRLGSDVARPYSLLGS